MSLVSLRGAGALFVGLGSLVASAAGQVVATNTFGGGSFGDKVGLAGVNVQRGGDFYGYTYEDMIGVTLSGINVPSATSRTVLLYADPLDSNRDQTMNDQFVNTGLYRPGDGPGDFSAGAEYFKLDFEHPVKNDTGPDLLVTSIAFDFSSGSQSHPTDYFVSFDGSNSSLVTSSAPEFRLSGVDSIPYYSYQGGVTSPSDLAGPVSHTGGLGNSTATATPTIQSLDLANLGIAPGATVSSIWIQDSSLNGNGFYPTMVLGLPAIPEPATGLLVACAALVSWRRRSS